MAVHPKQPMIAPSLKTPEIWSGVVKVSSVINVESADTMTWTKLKLKDKTAFET